jgi:hypothetical protein
VVAVSLPESDGRFCNGAIARVVGHSVSPEQNWNPTREESRWIGKPWRRIELLTQRQFYRGEEVGRDRDVTVHLGLRRLGLSLTLILGKHDVLDYSDEENQ